MIPIADYLAVFCLAIGLTWFVYAMGIKPLWKKANEEKR